MTTRGKVLSDAVCGGVPPWPRALTRPQRSATLPLSSWTSVSRCGRWSSGMRSARLGSSARRGLRSSGAQLSGDDLCCPAGGVVRDRGFPTAAAPHITPLCVLRCRFEGGGARSGSTDPWQACCMCVPERRQRPVAHGLVPSARASRRSAPPGLARGWSGSGRHQPCRSPAVQSRSRTTCVSECSFGHLGRTLLIRTDPGHG